MEYADFSHLEKEDFSYIDTRLGDGQEAMENIAGRIIEYELDRGRNIEELNTNYTSVAGEDLTGEAEVVRRRNNHTFLKNGEGAAGHTFYTEIILSEDQKVGLMVGEDMNGRGRYDTVQVGCDLNETDLEEYVERTIEQTEEKFDE